MKSKKWGIALVALSLLTLCAVGAVTAYIDPVFHYHKPLSFLAYPLDGARERYFNDGIVKHFDYDALITGTSMTENFRASECDALFGVNSIKVPFSGGSVTELSDTIRSALQKNPNLKLVICSIDELRLYQEQGYKQYDCPEYLYDNNYFNDVNYLLNKSILFRYSLAALEYTQEGHASTTFDEYGFWGEQEGYQYGREWAMKSYSRPSKVEEPQPLTDELYQLVMENLMLDYVSIAEEHPDTVFVYFFPPYSILAWDYLDRTGTMERELIQYELASSVLTQVENVRLYSFHDDYELITNLDNYKDKNHYSVEINSMILQAISQGEHLLTKDNYESHWQEVGDFYRSYDYDGIWDE